MRKIHSSMKFLLLLGFMVAYSVCGKSQTVSGTIVDAEKNQPLSGVTVKVVGTNTVTQTNNKGAFTIKATKGQTIAISYVGFEAQRILVSGGNINIGLKAVAADLDEVVVAMDIKRKPRELGYSVQGVTGKEIQESQRENFLNSLQGRVAGLSITSTGGQAGASSSIVLRGFNSLALSNSPLFIIDGIIVDNQTVNETSNGGSQLGLASDKPNRSNDYTNRIGDINPNDIESITVLKGPEATALYGSQASSGAIVITTKRVQTATGKISVFYDNSFRVQKLTRVPEVSHKFSQGSTGGIQDNSTFQYFGPEYPAGTQKYDNVKSFFKTGISQTHNISLDYGKKNYNIRFSGSIFDQSAVVPNNNYKRYNYRLSGYAKITKNLDIQPSVSYIRSTNDKPIRGAGGYLLNLLLWPSDNDASNYLDANGNKLILVSSDEVDNPFYNVNAVKSSDQTDRVIGTLGINFTPLKWLTFAGRFGYDTYRSVGYTTINPSSSLAKSTLGSQDNYYRNYFGYNHTVTATARKTYKSFTGSLMVGNMWQDYRTEQYAVSGTRLIDPYGTDSSNTNPATRVRLNNAQRTGGYNYILSRQVAYFGEVRLSYKNLVYLTYSHRFESSSIFPKEVRNYNYPAGSLSVIVSDIFPEIKKGNILNYLKLRTSLASTARSSAPYANQSVFNFVTSSGGGLAYGFFGTNLYLEPERQKTYEVGAEMKLLKNKLSVDVTFYNTLNEKQIVENFRSSYGGGFVLYTLNVGATRNTGLEVSIDANPIKTKNFSWNTRVNFNRARNEVLTLPDNVPEFYISDTWLYANARGGLVRGGPTTSITSFGYLRNNNGDILIDPANGLPLVESAFKVHGDRNPDFTIGFNNNLKYKNWSLSFLWDLKIGGDIFNGTEMFLTTRGVSKNTEDRQTPRVIKGVLKDGAENSATPTKNTIVVTPYYLQTLYTARTPEEAFIQTYVNWLRLRDITVSYTFPAATTKNWKYIKGLTFFGTGNDLILITNYRGADPAVNGNTAGTRGVGGFGFDYGNIGTPISLNFGLRANF